MAATSAQSTLAPNTPHDMSRSPTVRSEDTHGNDYAHTVSSNKEHDALDQSQLHGLDGRKSLDLEGKTAADHTATSGHNALASLPQSKKNVLLLIYCGAMFVDAAGVSATFLMTLPIGVDLGIKTGDLAWVLGTYSMIFAATLLFSGRLADLWPPHIIFTAGFVGVGVFSLIISFMEDQYAFFVLRSISALLAVMTIPSALNMLIQMFPDKEEQAKALALFGMAGALANVIALVIAGVFLLANWRWYFRAVAIFVLPLAALGFWLMPTTEAVAQSLDTKEKIKRLDLPGVAIVMAALILFILAFTQAPEKGWSSAIFIAPLVVAFALFAAFFTWEHFLPRGFALIPHDMWHYPNLGPLVLQAFSVFGWVATIQLRLATYFQEVQHHSAILSAARLLPMGIIAIVVGTMIQVFPVLVLRPKFVQPIASILAFVGTILFVFSDGGWGKDYWRFIFPAEIIGTGAAMIVFIGMQTSIIQSFPLENAGTGGSVAQIIFQIGGVVGIAVQAGFLTGKGLEDWKSSSDSFWFSGALILFTGLVFGLWYKQEKAPVHDGPAVAV